MEQDLYQIVYGSVATHLFEKEELLTLLRHARENNKRLGITGMLLHCEGSFIQVLEGPKDQVATLFQVIKQDPRHHRISVFVEELVKSRAFSHWHMGFRSPSLEELAKIEGYTPYLDLGDDPRAIQNYSAVALKLISAFKEISD
ncbi:MAG: phosphonate transporter [Nitrospirales bacterium]|nr:phosphonate transporter [Nitrospirales bacterium]